MQLRMHTALPVNREVQSFLLGIRAYDDLLEGRA